MTNSDNNTGLQLFYRLGLTSDQDILKDYRETYDGIVLSANHLAHFHKFDVKLLSQLNKPFFIDPVTYLYARHPRYMMNSNGDLKSSFVKLSDAYGKPFNEKLGKDALNPNDFSDQTLKIELIKNVINFQVERPVKLPKKYRRYQRFVENQDYLSPKFILPPYFYIDTVDNDWQKVNIDLAKTASELFENPVYPVIFISKEILISGKDISKVVQKYMEHDFDGYIIWIDGLSGVRAPSQYLIGYRDLISELSKQNKPIISLYGDYYSFLLYENGLKGLCSGICYSESKEIDMSPILGQIPKRYYVPQLRSKSQVDTTLKRVGIDEKDEFSCNCQICSDNAVIDLSRKQTQIHFMITRKRELDEIIERSTSDIINDLAHYYIEDNSSILNVKHIKSWSDSFNLLIKSPLEDNKKWADYGIEAVQYDNEKKFILRVLIRKDIGNIFGFKEEWTRIELVSAIESGSTFISILVNKKGTYEKGEDLHIVEVNETQYVRNDEVDNDSDFLKNLIEY